MDDTNLIISNKECLETYDTHVAKLKLCRGKKLDFEVVKEILMHHKIQLKPKPQITPCWHLLTFGQPTTYLVL